MHCVQCKEEKEPWVVIACNTASALALESVQEMTDIPVIGVVKPGAAAAVRETRTGRIGIIGTSATIGSGIYDKYIKELRPDAEIFGRACPLFVHLVEEGIIDDPVTAVMIHRYLDDMINKSRIDTLILGCTHYPLLRGIIARRKGCLLIRGSILITNFMLRTVRKAFAGLLHIFLKWIFRM